MARTSTACAWLLLGALALAPVRALAAACPAVPIDQTGDASEFRIGERIIRIRNPGSTTPPDIWDGPMEVENLATGARCSIDTDLMARPLVAFEDGLLVIPNYSGSDTWLTTLDLERCAIRHASRPVAGRARIVSNALLLGNAVPAGMPCDRIAPVSPPVRLERAISVLPLREGGEQVLVDDAPVFAERAQEVAVARRIAQGHVAFAILRIRAQDAGCPLRHRVLDLSGPRIAVSPAFGCGTLERAAIEGSTLRLTIRTAAGTMENRAFSAGQVAGETPRGRAPRQGTPR